MAGIVNGDYTLENWAKDIERKGPFGKQAAAFIRTGSMKAGAQACGEGRAVAVYWSKVKSMGGEMLAALNRVLDVGGGRK